MIESRNCPLTRNRGAPVRPGLRNSHAGRGHAQVPVVRQGLLHDRQEEHLAIFGIVRHGVDVHRARGLVEALLQLGKDAGVFDRVDGADDGNYDRDEDDGDRASGHADADRGGGGGGGGAEASDRNPTDTREERGCEGTSHRGSKPDGEGRDGNREEGADRTRCDRRRHADREGDRRSHALNRGLGVGVGIGAGRASGPVGDKLLERRRPRAADQAPVAAFLAYRPGTVRSEAKRHHSRRRSPRRLQRIRRQRVGILRHLVRAGRASPLVVLLHREPRRCRFLGEHEIAERRQRRLLDLRQRLAIALAHGEANEPAQQVGANVLRGKVREPLVVGDAVQRRERLPRLELEWLPCRGGRLFDDAIPRLDRIEHHRSVRDFEERAQAAPRPRQARAAKAAQPGEQGGVLLGRRLGRGRRVTHWFVGHRC